MGGNLAAKVCASESFEAARDKQSGAPEASAPQRLSLVKGSSIVRNADLERVSVSAWSLSRSKRLFDIAVAVPVLAVFSVPMLLIAICIRLTSRGPAIFVQQRVGRNGRLFSIYKFRSMTVAQGQHKGLGLTKEGDCRITGLGRWLRKLKLDELPQLFNVLRGELSLVGPRPKLPQYEAVHNMPYRPGITGASTLAFRNEEEILSRVPAEEMELFYHQRIKPLKARVDARYMKRATFWTDLKMITTTVFSCVAPGRSRTAPKTAKPAAAPQPVTYLDYSRESYETTS
jgi:lipopolysaccharide/colanic/teichoic acid biosynthesis glycosyltransferase